MFGNVLDLLLVGGIVLAAVAYMVIRIIRNNQPKPPGCGPSCGCG